MTRIHSTLIALVMCAAATAGLYAATKTVQLGQKAAAPSVSRHELASRQAKLVAWHSSLVAARAKRLPALPKLPRFAPVRAPQTPSVPVATAQPHISYVQAPTVVKFEHAPAPPTITTTSSWNDDDSSDDDADDGGGD